MITHFSETSLRPLEKKKKKKICLVSSERDEKVKKKNAVLVAYKHICSLLIFNRVRFLK